MEESDFRLVTNPSNTILLPFGASRGERVAHLSRTIPTNDFGLPSFFIRTDLLDWSSIESEGHTTHDALQAAVEPLEYHDGYPTLRSGTPFWSRLPHEPHQDYILFQEFLELAETEGIRLLDSLATKQEVDLERIRELSLLYFWSSRARAYDLFIVAAEAKKRQVRTRKTESSHFEQSSAILDSVIARINDTPDLIQKMDATDLFNLFEQMVKIQRLSLGLTGANASTRNDIQANPASTVEVILRTMTQNSGLSSQSADGFQNRLALLMADPATAMQAQELVIRATTDNRVMGDK